MATVVCKARHVKKCIFNEFQSDLTPLITLKLSKMEHKMD